VYDFAPEMNGNHTQRMFFFSPYGLCGANTRFTVNNITAKRGIKNKKKVRLLI